VKDFFKELVSWIGQRWCLTISRILHVLILGYIGVTTSASFGQANKLRANSTATVGLGKTSSSGQVSAQSDSRAYSNSPFDLSLLKLPIDYIGNDPQELYKQLIKQQWRKGEFEKTQDYKARLEHAAILGTLRFDTLYAFQANRLFTEIEPPYDADKEQFKLRIITAPIAYVLSTPDSWTAVPLKLTQTFVGEKLYEKSYEILIHKRSELFELGKIHMAPKVAEQAREDIRAILIGNLEKPYSETGVRDSSYVVTVAYGLHFRLKGIWFYYSSSGEIIAKFP
jgi:hypothetical protein